MKKLMIGMSLAAMAVTIGLAGSAEARKSRRANWNHAPEARSSTYASHRANRFRQPERSYERAIRPYRKNGRYSSRLHVAKRTHARWLERTKMGRARKRTLNQRWRRYIKKSPRFKKFKNARWFN